MELLLKILFITLISFGVLALLFGLLVKKIFFNPRVFPIVSRNFYNYYYSFKKIEHLRTNNYGYAPVDEDISEYDPDLRHGIQLYKETVKNHSGYLIDTSSSVVEVGCGKGAGADYLIKTCLPKKYTAIDFSEKAIEFCRNAYQQGNHVNFVCGNALSIPYDENAADVVLNIESSHLYKSQEKFFREVHRILKPGGKFLLADYRKVRDCPIEDLEREIDHCGFVIREKRIITEQIRNSCSASSDRRNQLVNEVIPWFLRRPFRQFAIVNNSKKARMLQNGEVIYFIYHIEKVDRVLQKSLYETHPMQRAAI